MTSEIICGKCGSIYKLTGIKFPVQDQGSIDCRVCGEELKRWNGTTDLMAELIEKYEKHLQKD
jgi:ribosomal protein S27E